MHINRRQFIALALATGAAPSLAAARKSGEVSAAQGFLDAFCREGPALDTDNGNVWHTESLGISLLAAARVKDEKKFAELYAQGQLLRREDGLYSWKAKKDRVLDRNNATDGDIYIAWALITAAQARMRLPFSPVQEARELLSAIEEHCVQQSTHGVVLIPGVHGFTPKDKPWTINLSYWVFPALVRFAQLDPSGPWRALISSGLNLLDFAYFSDYGLPSDWLELSDPVKPGKLHPPRFAYDAMRISLYLSKAGFTSHRTVGATKQFFEKTNKSWIDLTSGEMSHYGLDDSARVVLGHLQGNSSLKTLPAAYFPASLAVLADYSVVTP